ncbi:MAG: hypothetical protein ACJ78Q_01445, partial [Chloroflexia bacterium]
CFLAAAYGRRGALLMEVDRLKPDPVRRAARRIERARQAGLPVHEYDANVLLSWTIYHGVEQLLGVPNHLAQAIVHCYDRDRAAFTEVLRHWLVAQGLEPEGLLSAAQHSDEVNRQRQVEGLHAFGKKVLATPEPIEPEVGQPEERSDPVAASWAEDLVPA